VKRPRPYAAAALRRLAAVALCLLVACAGKLCGDPYLAELSAHRGDVQRDEAKRVGSWSKVAEGEKFHVGDGLRTGAKGSAQLTLSSDGVALVEENTLLRFLDQDPRQGERRLSLEQGVLRIEAGRVELDVHTPRAFARVLENSTVRIIADGNEVRFDVLVGRVAISDDAGAQQLQAGEQRTLRTTLAEAPKDVEEPREPSPEPAVEPRASERTAVDVTLGKLEALTLHAPNVPLALAIPAPDCDAELRLEGAGPVLRAEAGVFRPRLGGGSHALRVRCGRRVVQQATVQVQRDLATLELPKSAQRLDVDADGRRYTVRYQNLLPIVTVGWSSARPAGSYALVLKHGKREKSFRGSAPRQTLPANALGEGDYEFWFTSSGGQRSEVSSLRIEFDNTARSLSLVEPREGSAAGERTWVSGVALLRSQVSANGVPLTLDAKGRFRAEVPVDTARSVVVRATHPAAGVHYYVRRLR
jgi:hypothetical protein